MLNGQLQQLQANKSKASKGSDLSGIKIWNYSPGEHPRSPELLSKSKKKPRINGEGKFMVNINDSLDVSPALMKTVTCFTNPFAVSL